MKLCKLVAKTRNSNGKQNFDTNNLIVIIVSSSFLILSRPWFRRDDPKSRSGVCFVGSWLTGRCDYNCWYSIASAEVRLDMFAANSIGTDTEYVVLRAQRVYLHGTPLETREKFARSTSTLSTTSAYSDSWGSSTARIKHRLHCITRTTSSGTNACWPSVRRSGRILASVQSAWRILYLFNSLLHVHF